MPPLWTGGRTKCDIVAELRFRPRPIRRRSAKFLLYDIRPSEAMVVTFGSPECVRSLGLGPDGTFKTSPRLRAHVYTAHVHFSVFSIPRAYAILPEKKAGAYAAIWQKFAPIYFTRPRTWGGWSIWISMSPRSGARPKLFMGFGSHVDISTWWNLPTAKFSQSVYVDNTLPKLSSNCARRCTPALAHPKDDEVATKFGLVATLFAEADHEIFAYFETNYIARLVGGSRRNPTFYLEVRNVRIRMEAGALRAKTRMRRASTDLPLGYRGANC